MCGFPHGFSLFHFQTIRDFFDIALPYYLYCLRLVFDERIVGMADGRVAFRVRANADSGKKRINYSPGEAFIDRFLLHVLPAGFKRIRHYGLLAAAHKRQRLATARQALAVPPPIPRVVESVMAFLRRVEREDWCRCPVSASGRFVVTGVIAPESRRVPSATGPP